MHHRLRRCAPRRGSRRRTAVRRTGCRRRATGRNRRHRCRPAAARPGAPPVRRVPAGGSDRSTSPAYQREKRPRRQRQGSARPAFSVKDGQEIVRQRGRIPQQLKRRAGGRPSSARSRPLRHHRGDGAARGVTGDSQPGRVGADLRSRDRRPIASRPRRLRRQRGRGARAPTGNRPTPRSCRRPPHADGRCRRGCRGRR